MTLKCQFIVLLTINILYKINCQECTCGTEPDSSTCGQEACVGTCRFFHDNSCLQCGNEIQENSYYYKEGTSCVLWESKSDNQKIIGDTKEVVNGGCPENYKSLGDYCYISGSLGLNNSNPESVNSNAYKCVNYFYKENNNGFIKYECVPSENDCSASEGQNIEGTKQCFKCESGKEYYQIGENDIITCESECPDDKPFIKTGSLYKCINSCQDESKYYRQISRTKENSDS